MNELFRKVFWCAVFVGCIRGSGAPSRMEAWADFALKSFDARFLKVSACEDSARKDGE
jgi:hypothetical protein